MHKTAPALESETYGTFAHFAVSGWTANIVSQWMRVRRGVVRVLASKTLRAPSSLSALNNHRCKVFRLVLMETAHDTDRT